MALIDKASLLMVPSVYEDGTLYNVLPSGNKAPDETGNHNGYDQTRADFTFSRGSNLAATRVNSDGLIEKGRENLLLQSNQFDTTWATNNASVTSGQSGYDGSSNAWKLQSSSAGINYLHQLISSNAVQTFSIYAKAGNTDWMRINILQSGANANNYYDIANGVKGASPSSPIIDDKIESVGDGWYRISIVANISITQIRIQTAVADGNETSASGDNIYIQNAQLEAGLVATDYIETGATTATAGVLENTPRIDYSSGAGALLLEPQRTNAVTQSEYLNGISWNGKIGTSFDTNVTTSPEGLSNASLLKEDSSNGSHFAYKDFNLTSGTTYTISIYAKANGVNRNLRYSDGGVGWSSGFTALFDLTAGTATGGTIESIGSGWYRCSVTGTTNATTSRFIIYSTLDEATTYQGDGTSGVYLYGFQLEAGSHVSSYVPTYGSAATRGAENLFVESLANELTTGYTSATLMIEFKYKQDSVGDAFVWGQDNNTYPAGRGYLYNKQSGFADSFGGGGFNDMSEDTTLKLIYRLNTLSNADVFLNGTKGTNVSGTAWSAINQIRFRGAYYTFEISQIAMYSEALTDAECVTLTTL